MSDSWCPNRRPIRRPRRLTREEIEAEEEARLEREFVAEMEAKGRADIVADDEDGIAFGKWQRQRLRSGGQEGKSRRGRTLGG